MSKSATAKNAWRKKRYRDSGYKKNGTRENAQGLKSSREVLRLSRNQRRSLRYV